MIPLAIWTFQLDVFYQVSGMKICIKCTQLKRVVGFADKEQRLILAKWIRSKESNFLQSHPRKVTKVLQGALDAPN